MNENEQLIKEHIEEILSIFSKEKNIIVKEYDSFFDIEVYDKPMVSTVIERIMEFGYRFDYVTTDPIHSYLFGSFTVMKQ